MKLISANSNRPLAESVAKSMGIALAATNIKRFSDMEVFVEIEENVRGQDVFVLQSTSFPANDHIMELLVCIDGLKRASARRITAVLPYFGYARQDRKPKPRAPISAKLVADIITVAGAHRVLTLDLHAGQIQGFFNIPVDNLYAAPLFCEDILRHHAADNVVIVSPDVGGVGRARGMAKRLGASLAVIDKRRDAPGASEVMHVIGEIAGRHCLLIDDIVDSAGTLCNAAQALMAKGAASVGAYVTHAVLSGEACERVAASSLTELVVTDSIMLDFNKKMNKIRQVSIAPLLGEAIRRIADEASVSSLFD